MPHRFKVYDGAYPHFITSAILHWIPVFRRDDYFRVLADSLIYCSANKGLLIHGFVFMPDHFHAICTHVDGQLTEVIRDIKGFTARRIKMMLQEDNRQLWLRAMERAAGGRSEIKVWQDSFHPEQVHTQPFFQQKLDYMHNNPLRAGFVDDPCAWRYSSAGFYLQDMDSVVPIVPIEW